MDYRNQRMFESLAVVATAGPVSQAAGTLDTDVIDMQRWQRVLFIFQTGVLTATNTTDFAIFASATSGGTYAAVAGKAITQLLAAGGNGRCAMVEIDAKDLLALGKRYIKGRVTVATAAGLVSVIALGTNNRSEPYAATEDDADLVERVA